MALFWRIMRDRSRIGKPWKVSYGYIGRSDLRGTLFWKSVYSEGFNTEEEARASEKYRAVGGAPVSGEWKGWDR